MTKTPSPYQGVLSPRHVRFLKISIAVMTTLLLLGIAALVIGVVRQMSRAGAPAAPVAASTAQAPYKLSMDLGQGKLEAVSASGGLLILHWRGEESDIVLSIDPRNGHELGRIQVPRR